MRFVASSPRITSTVSPTSMSLSGRAVHVPALIRFGGEPTARRTLKLMLMLRFLHASGLRALMGLLKLVSALLVRLTLTIQERFRVRKALDTAPYIVTILGEPASKANSRRAVIIKGSPRFIKSTKALSYKEVFLVQCPKKEPLFKEIALVVGLKIYYASRRPDLDESLILDLLQKLVYGNDRQVRFKVVGWGLDKANPRCHIFVAPIEQVKEAIEFVQAV